MTQQFIDLSTLALDGEYLEQIKLKLEDAKNSLLNDGSFCWIGTHDEILKDAQAILENVEQWESAKALIDSRLKDNQYELSSLASLVSEVNDALENGLGADEDEEDVDNSDVLKLSFNAFKQLTRMGNIVYLEGIVHRENRHPEKLFLNDNDKIRPPMNRLGEKDMFFISDIDIEIQGSDIGFDALKTILAAMNLS